MRRIGILLVAVFLLSVGPAWGQMITYTPNAGISGTPHDFTQHYTVTSTVAGGVGQCTMCHTPHKAQATRLLWNHTYANGPWSWTDVTTTTAGTTLPTITKTWNGPTPKCLSCHDGTVAVGDIQWFDAQAQVVSVSGQSFLTNGKINDPAFQIGAGGSMNGNHPVMVPYPVGGARNTYNQNQTGAQFVSSDFVSDPTTLNIVLYNDNGGTNVTRVVSNASGTSNGIECSSCHDPHNKGGVDADDYFLRGHLTGNTTAYICLKCHVK